MVRNAPLKLSSKISMIFSITLSISFAEVFDCSARCLISSATTAKPLPASPALAASILAFKDNRFVCSAMEAIMFAASWIFWIALFVSDTLFDTFSVAL